MINKIVGTVAEALRDIRDGSVVMVGGFGSVGQPDALIEGLVEQGARDLPVVANNTGAGRSELGMLLAAGRVRRMLCSCPRASGSTVIPLGTLAERICAAGVGIGAFYTPTG
ncbi:CoA-transferase [Lichenicoccus sp.]|uniref:CoA-transferase n=1 Tax=Lichenicoccus sp. TaxID=2781899 RepID=UPI003D0D05FD